MAEQWDRRQSGVYKIFTERVDFLWLATTKTISEPNYHIHAQTLS